MNSSIPAVLITGAGSGIGAATARLFSKNGNPVVLNGRRLEKLEEVAKTLQGPSLIVDADISTVGGSAQLVEAALKKMDVGVLINNAGIFERGPFAESTDEAWEQTFQVNLHAPVRLARLLLPHFLERKEGIIVNVASTAGLRPVPGMSPYTASKAALIGFSQSLALELANKNIRVHCICPGIVETPIHVDERTDALTLKTLHENWSKMHPLGRAGKATDVASAVCFLCSPGSEWMTGVVLPVDGGISLT